MKQANRLFIVGQPGAGKTVLAKAIADKLGWEFIDADFGLEFKIGLGVETILGADGANSFQNMQAHILNSLIQKNKIVVATDGCVVDSEKNRALLSSELTVFIDVSLAIQLDRISRDYLPLLEENEVNDFLQHLHLKRDHLFNQVSSMAVQTDDNAIERHVNNIFEFVTENHRIEPKSENKLLSNRDTVLFHKILHTPIFLTPQQAKCLKLLAHGKSAKEIARDMNVSFRTIEAHIAKIIEISGCSNSKEIISLYLS